MNIFTSLISFDYKIQNIVLGFRNESLDSFFFLFTKLGNWQVIIGLLLTISIFFWFYKKGILILPFISITLGTGIMTLVVKYLVGRTRPGSDVALYVEKLSSFPSAHAALIIALFGFLIFCLWRFEINQKIRFLLSSFFVLVILLVGFSRVYLGVHFITDVIGGYLVGLLWLITTIYCFRKYSSLGNNRF